MNTAYLCFSIQTAAAERHKGTREERETRELTLATLALILICLYLGAFDISGFTQ